MCKKSTFVSITEPFPVRFQQFNSDKPTKSNNHITLTESIIGFSIINWICLLYIDDFALCTKLNQKLAKKHNNYKTRSKTNSKTINYLPELRWNAKF